MNRLFEKKDDIVLEDLQDIEPALMVVFLATILYAKENNLVVRVTSVKSDRKNVNSVSNTHETGRAIDVGCRSSDGWNSLHTNRLCFVLNKSYGSDLGAYSLKDNIPRVAVHHDSGNGDHVHLQVRPGVSLGKYVSITRS